MMTRDDTSPLKFDRCGMGRLWGSSMVRFLEEW